jgi:two-component system, OmpR family, KDP operon response regulator KdpE
MSKSGTSVLVIDDEIQLRRMLRISLEGAGYRVWEAATGEEGLVEAASRRPEIILLDLSLPDMNGVAVLKRLREWSTVPVLILSVHDAEREKVAALDAGADDYVTKPFHTEELLARLRVSQRRRVTESSSQIFEHSGLSIDFVARDVRFRTNPIHLTPTEYSLLRLLAINAGKVLTSSYILREIWGPKSTEQSQYLRVYASQLRSKLVQAGASKTLIKTETGIGYRLPTE